MKKILGIVVLGLLLSGNAYTKELIFKCNSIKLPEGSFNYNTRIIDTVKRTVTLKYQYSDLGIKSHNKVYGFEPSPDPYEFTLNIYELDEKKVKFGRTQLEHWQDMYQKYGKEKFNTDDPKRLKKLIKKAGDPNLHSVLSTWNYSVEGDVNLKGYHFKKKWNELSPTNIACFSEKYAMNKKKQQTVKQLEPLKAMCRNIGYSDGTEKFADCVKDLYLKNMEASNQNQTTSNMIGTPKKKIDPSVWDDLGNISESLLGGSSVSESLSGVSSSGGSRKITCFKTGEETGGLNKICRYDCVGNLVTTTVGAAQMCPIQIQR